MELRLSNRRPPAARYPLGIEIALVRGMRALARAARDDVLALVAERLPAILALAARDTAPARADAESAEQPAEQTGWAAALAALVALAASRVAVRMSAARALIAEARRGVHRHLLSHWRKTLLQAYGVDSLGPGREPALGPLFASWEQGVADATERLGADLVGRLRAAVVRAATSGATMREATVAARDALDVEGRAEAVGRIAVGQLVGQINRVRQNAAGVASYQWVSQRDERVRPRHKMQDGRTYSWNAAPSGGHPGEAPRCRCFARAKLPERLVIQAA